MLPSDLKDRFIQIYRHEYYLPIDVTNEEYQHLAVIDNFLRDCSIPVNYNRIRQALKIYQEFAVYFTVDQLVKNREVYFYYDEEISDYSYSRPQQGLFSAPTPADETKHAEYIGKKIDELILDYQQLVENIKRSTTVN